MSLETAVIGGLLGAAFSLLFLVSFMDKKQLGFLRTIFMFTALGFVLVAVQSIAGFLKITYQTSADPIHLAMANSVQTLYVVLLDVIIIALLSIAGILFWNAILGLWDGYFKKKEPQDDIS